MAEEPDGVEVVATAAEAELLRLPPLLVVESVARFFDEHGLGSGELGWRRIGDGQSNVTYLIERGGEAFVLRRGPRPPLPRSAHDMVREAAMQTHLRDAGVRVPRILAVCDDRSVLGVPFYVMEHLDGVVITDSIPSALGSPGQRRATVDAAVDALVGLHRVDVSAGPLSEFGRPAGYLERQVRLFSSLWPAYTRREVPEVAVVADWLRGNLPESRTYSVVHGDYRLGNLMFRDGAPATVLAILDWEMATIGDPLADLGYLIATYASPESVPTPMELTPVTREPGYPSRNDLVARYSSQLDSDLTHLAWYEALALWKAAIFCEAMFTRWKNGERPGDGFAPTLELGVPLLLRQALTATGR